MHTKAIALSALATTALAAQTAQAQTDAPMTFFVTSTTHSGDLGGLAGAQSRASTRVTESVTAHGITPTAS
jgi:hypothetical protein